MNLDCQNGEKQELFSNGIVLLKAWQKYAAKAGGIPDRSHINPNDFKSILPFVSMAQNLDEKTVKVTLVGTGIVLRNGYEPTGQNWIDYLTDSEKSFFLKLQKPKFETPCGILYRAKTTPKNGHKSFYIDNLTLPFLKNGLNCSIAVDQEVDTQKLTKYDGWGDGAYKILEMKLVDIGFGLPNEVYSFN